MIVLYVISVPFYIFELFHNFLFNSMKDKREREEERRLAGMKEG